MELALKEKMALNNYITRKLTERIIYERTGENIEGTLNETTEEIDDANFQESELPAPLEKLAVEINKLMRLPKMVSTLSESFTKDKEQDLEEELPCECYSDCSDLMDETVEGNEEKKEESKSEGNFEVNFSKMESEARRSIAEKNSELEETKNLINACEKCDTVFTWVIWRHRCRACEKYFFI